MNKNNLDSLLKGIKDNETVKRVNQLAKIIVDNEEYLMRYQELQNLAKQYCSSHDSETKKRYDEILDAFKQDLIINEYLNEIEEVNQIIALLNTIFTSTLDL